jgi:hypothetical protein
MKTNGVLICAECGHEYLAPRRCEACGEEYQPKKRWARFCSDICRKDYWLAQYHLRKPAPSNGSFFRRV